MKWLSKSWPIILIVLFGGILRFYGFADWSLSNDELSYLTRFHLPNAWEVFLYGMTVDVHPPAVQTFLYWWTSVFGDSPATIRLPFVLFGIASVILVYLIGRSWFSESAGLLSAVFLSGLQHPLLFSRVARPYGFGMLVILVTAFFLGKVLGRKNPKWLDVLGMAVGLALCAYTHYFCALSASILSGTGLLFTSAENRKRYLVALIGAAVFFSPYLFFIEQHLSQGGLDDWLPTPTWSWLFEYLFHAVNSSWLVLLTAVVVVTWGVFGKVNTTKFMSRTWLCIAVFFGTFIIGFTYSLVVEPIMQFSALLFSFPFLLLGVFGGVSFNPKVIRYVICGLVLLIGIDTVALQRFYKVQHYGVFEELVEKAIELRTEDPDALIIADVNHHLYLDYYAERLGRKEFKFDNYSLTEGDDLKRLHWLCKNSSSDNCLLAWSTKGQLPEHAAIVEHYFPVVEELGQHFNSGFIHFAKGQPSNTLMSSFQGKRENGWNVNDSQLILNSSGFEFKMSESAEFGPTYEVGIDEEFDTFNLVTVRVDAQIFQPESEFQLVCTQHLNDDSDLWESRPFSHQLDSNRPGTAVFRFYLNEKVRKGGTLKIYPWLPVSGDSAKISGLEIEFALRAAFQ